MFEVVSLTAIAILAVLAVVATACLVATINWHERD